jgi:hypothetical protein
MYGLVLWPITWNLSKGAGAKGGYIIQHIHISYQAYTTDPRDGTPRNPFENYRPRATVGFTRRKPTEDEEKDSVVWEQQYYEAWRVEPDKNVSTVKGQMSEADISYYGSTGVDKEDKVCRTKF